MMTEPMQAFVLLLATCGVCVYLLLNDGDN